MNQKLIPLGISFWLGPYPHIREFTKIISGESAFRFNGVRVWLTPKEWAAVESAYGHETRSYCKTRAIDRRSEWRSDDV
jgi:hypothetical protein